MPVPSQTGHVRRLKSSTENITPKERPRPDFIRRLERHRSHLSFSRVSLRGRVARATGAGGAVVGVLASFSADMVENAVSGQGEGYQNGLGCA